MGSGQLRDEFNRVAAPTYNCTMALLDYRRDDKTGESQVLTFIGNKDSGEAFRITSRLIKPAEDVNVVAAETARAMISEDLAP